MARRILVAVDGSPSSEHALERALALLEGQPVHLRLIHVLDVDLFSSLLGGQDETAHEVWRQTGQRYLEQAAALARARGVEADTKLVENAGRRISRAIAEEGAAWPADLVVIGAHGRRGLDHFLMGSTAEGVVRSATVPVMTVRGD